MTFASDPRERQPKGDHNRRLSLGLDPDEFAAEAGISVEELRDYERTAPDHTFSPMIAERVGAALDRLERVLPNSEAAGIRQILGTDDLTGVSASHSDDAQEQWIKDTAYHLWESEGRPEGRDQEYWHRAREAWVGRRALDKGFEEAVAEPDPAAMDRAVEESRKIGLQRPFNNDPADNTIGGFNQKR